MINFDYIETHKEEIKKIFKNASFFYPISPESIINSIENGNYIRLFCTRNVFYGDITVMENIVKVMNLLNSNFFKFHDSADNFWIDLYYVLSENELKELKRYKLLKELNELDNG